MENMQYKSSVERVVNRYWNLVERNRGDRSVKDMFVPVMGLLYSAHKGYSIAYATDVANDCRVLSLEDNGDKVLGFIKSLFPKGLIFNGDITHFIGRKYAKQRGFETEEPIDLNSVYPDVVKGLFCKFCDNGGIQ